MKKLYSQPTCLIVKLDTTKNMMQATSLQIFEDKVIENSEDILVKESTVSDINLWDNEW